MYWEDVLREKIHQLEIVASWASMTGFGGTRDHARMAQWELVKKVERIKEESCKAKGEKR